MFSAARRSILRTLRRFRRGRRGATAVEFALVITPFLALVGWIIELGLMGFTAFVLTGAAEEGGRLIRTGQAQQSGSPAAAFRERVCARTFGLIDCDEIVYTVRTFDNFAEAESFYQNYRLVRNQNGDWVWQHINDASDTIPADIDMGGASEITIVRVAFRRDFIGPGGALFIGGDMDGVTLQASTAFRNAPYREDD